MGCLKRVWLTVIVSTLWLHGCGAGQPQGPENKKQENRDDFQPLTDTGETVQDSETATVLSDTETSVSIDLSVPFEDADRVVIWAIGDQRCPLKGCVSVKTIAERLKSYFPKAEIVPLDWAVPLAREIFHKSGQTRLPVAVAKGPVHSIAHRPYYKEYMTPIPDTHLSVYRAGRLWDPMVETCDDEIDNLDNGKVDCADETCHDRLTCRPEIINHLDMFVSLPISKSGVDEVHMLRYVQYRFREDEKMSIELNVVSQEMRDIYNPPKKASPEEELAAKRLLCVQELSGNVNELVSFFQCAYPINDNADWAKCLPGNMDAGAVSDCAKGETGRNLLNGSFKKAAGLDVIVTPAFAVNNQHPVRASIKEVSVKTMGQVATAYCQFNSGSKGCSDMAELPRPNIEWVHSKAAGLDFTKTEITVAQFRQYLTSDPLWQNSRYQMFSEKSYDKDDLLRRTGDSQYDNHPVAIANATDGENFCRWIGGRLPTEAEWMREATNRWRRKWPWGNAPIKCGRAVFNQNPQWKYPCKGEGTRPVCSVEQGNSISGLCDMVGNLQEVVAPDFRTADAAWVVGGGYYTSRRPRRVYDMSWVYDYGHLGGYSGFRCVKSDKNTQEANGLKFERACERIKNLTVWDSAYKIKKPLQCDQTTYKDRKARRLSRKHFFLKPCQKKEGCDWPIELSKESDWPIESSECMPFKDGALALRHNPVPCESESGDSYIEVPVLVYMPAKGAMSHADLGNLDMNNASWCHSGIQNMEIHGPYDLNRDGNRNMLYLYQDYSCEEFHDEWSALIRYHNGKLRGINFENQLDSGFNVAALRDKTGDNKPDILFDRWVYGSYCGSGFGSVYSTLTVLAEVKSNGNLDFTSPAAVNWLKTQCPKKPEKLDTIHNVACARVWGMSTQKAIAEIKKVRKPGCIDPYEDDDDYPAILDAARIRFPVMLEESPTRR